MKKFFVRVGTALFGMDESAQKSILRLAEGECVELEMKRARSPQFNRLYWGACAEIGRRCEPERDQESISNEIKIRAGHYEVMKLEGIDAIIQVPKHINFRAMDADEWAAFFLKADQVMLQHFGFDSASFE